GPPSDEAAPPGLLALRGALYQAGREGGRAQMSRFRPLCDRDGYPLVGNIANKSNIYHPSQLCSDLRKAER
ncbi:MAG TPA: hypothetical protein VFS00_18340, partial [Polyangiaceae bacterium]|nr:hypothetical protein [Polyangiaceae bacterium]